jgi:uncharacterized repeat protein (TIGR01451 family)
MYKGWKLPVPWAMFKMTLLVVLLLATASGGQEPCNDADGNCRPLWSLQAKEDATFAQASESFENDLVGPNAIDMARIAFDFQNQSASPEIRQVTASNDSVKVIELFAGDINNDLLSFEITRLPLHGNISGTAPNIIYQPNAGYTGNDSFIVSATSVSGTEKNLTVSVDVVSLSHPPTVRIRSPRNGEVFTAIPGPDGATGYSVEIPVHATSSGDVQSISFYDNSDPDPIGSGICEDSSGNCPVTIIHNFLAGTHVLTAKAFSTRWGNSCPSLPVVIVVNPSQPVVRITNPLSGQIFTSPEEITITAEVIDSNPVSRVEFYANSQMIWSTTESKSTYTFEWGSVKPGVYNIVVKAIEDPNTIAISKPALIIVVPERPLSKSDLALSMASTSNPAPVGGLFNYILTVTNRGPDSATAVTVQDYLPPELELMSFKASQGDFTSGVWELGKLTKYNSARLVLNVRVLPGVPLQQIANTAYVYGAERDQDNSNNYATVYTNIEQSWVPVPQANSTEAASVDANLTDMASLDINSTVVAFAQA